MCNSTNINHKLFKEEYLNAMRRVASCKNICISPGLGNSFRVEDAKMYEIWNVLKDRKLIGVFVERGVQKHICIGKALEEIFLHRWPCKLEFSDTAYDTNGDAASWIRSRIG